MNFPFLPSSSHSHSNSAPPPHNHPSNFFLSPAIPKNRFSLANSVYKSLQDNNEDQAIICLGESASGKSENCRMIIKFLSNISGRRMQLIQRQRSSNSIASYKNSPKSNCSTPKHKTMTATAIQKSSCIKTPQQEGGKNKKLSRVEFDFSYQKCNNNQQQDLVRYCPKHNCCTQQQNVSSSSSTTSTTIPIDIPQFSSSSRHFDDSPSAVSKSFTIYESMNRVHHRSSLPNCHSKSLRCESFVNITPPSSSNCSSIKSSSTATREYVEGIKANTQVQCDTTTTTTTTCARNNNINLDNFKSAKRKVPIKSFIQHSHLEIQAMKEKIAQAEIFLDAMGNAMTTRNRDSSRYVRIWIDCCELNVHFSVYNLGQIY
jgi:myosin I